MSGKTIVTLNISPTTVRLLSLRGKEVDKWGSMPLPLGLVRDGLILKPKVVGTVINSLFKSTGATRKNVIVSITGLSFIHRILTLPRMESDALSEALQRAARKEMLLPLEDLYLCGHVIGKKADEINFLVFGAPRHPIDALLQSLKEANIQSYVIDLSPLALARVARRQEAVIVNLEPECYDIVLVADGLPGVMHTITLKTDGATPLENMHKLADELAKTVEFYNNNHPQNPLNPATPVLITGESSTNLAAGELNIADTVYTIKPLNAPLTLPGDLPAAAYATNIGLALRELSLKSEDNGETTHFRDIKINVLSGQFGIGKRWFKLPHILLSLAIIAGLGLLFPMNQLSSQTDAETTRLRADFTAVNQELSQARSIAEKAIQIEEKITKLIADADTITRNYQNISSLGGNYAYYLKLVTDTLPAGAIFVSIDIGKKQISLTGTADTPFTVINYVTALEALRIFNDVRILSIGDSENTASAAVAFGILIDKKT